MRHLTTIFIVALLGAIALSFAVQAWNHSSALELETPVELPPPVPADEIVDEQPRPATPEPTEPTEPDAVVKPGEPRREAPTFAPARNQCAGVECQPQKSYSAPAPRRRWLPWRRR